MVTYTPATETPARYARQIPVIAHEKLVVNAIYLYNVMLCIQNKHRGVEIEEERARYVDVDVSGQCDAASMALPNCFFLLQGILNHLQ